MVKTATYTISALLLIFLGLFIVISPTDVLFILVLLFSLYILVDGSRSLITSLKEAVSEKVKRILLVRGIVNIVFSLILLYLSVTKRSTLSLIVVYIASLDLLLSALVDFYDYVILKKENFTLEGLFIQGFSSLLSSFILFFFPRESFRVITALLGAVIMAAGVILGYSVYKNYTSSKELNNY